MAFQNIMASREIVNPEKCITAKLQYEFFIEYDGFQVRLRKFVNQGEDISGIACMHYIPGAETK